MSEHREVWKYELVPDQQHIEMPVGAELLHVNTQRIERHGPDNFGQWDQPCLWALVDPFAEKTRRGIVVHGTGHPIIPGGAYVGTFHLAGPLVFHVFDHGEEP